MVRAGDIVRIRPRAEWPPEPWWPENPLATMQGHELESVPAGVLWAVTSAGTSLANIRSIEPTQRHWTVLLTTLETVVPKEHRWDLACSVADVTKFVQWYESLALLTQRPVDGRG